MCDADLLFLNCIAKWPGSVHDARVLRESSLFDAFESELQRTYNSARTAVERAIVVLKRRWHSLRRLRLAPAKACQVITVCIMLHNRARLLKLEVPSDSESDNDPVSESSSEDADSGGEAEQLRSANNPMLERARVAQ